MVEMESRCNRLVHFSSLLDCVALSGLTHISMSVFICRVEFVRRVAVTMSEQEEDLKLFACHGCTISSSGLMLVWLVQV